MKRRLGADGLFFGVVFPALAATAAVAYGHPGWGIVFASVSLTTTGIGLRRYVRRRRGSDWYEH